MALLTYHRCWSGEEKREARRFLIDHPTAPPGAIGCTTDAPLPPEQVTASESVWDFIVTKDGDLIVAVHAFSFEAGQDRPTFVHPEHYIRVWVASLHPDYEPGALFTNMMIAVATLLPWDVSQTWFSIVPDTPAVAAMAAGPFGVGMTIDPSPDPLFVKVVGVRPDPVPAHFDVPLR